MRPLELPSTCHGVPRTVPRAGAPIHHQLQAALLVRRPPGALSAQARAPPAACGPAARQQPTAGQAAGAPPSLHRPQPHCPRLVYHRKTVSGRCRVLYGMGLSTWLGVGCWPLAAAAVAHLNAAWGARKCQGAAQARWRRWPGGPGASPPPAGWRRPGQRPPKACNRGVETQGRDAQGRVSARRLRHRSHLRRARTTGHDMPAQLRGRGACWGGL